MNEKELANSIAKLQKDVLERMEQAYQQEGMKRILSMIVSFHSCDGAAYYNVIDYLSKKGY